MSRVLMICSSTDGQTLKICTRLRAKLEDAGYPSTLIDIAQADAVSPAVFDLVVVGARIRYGRTDRRVFDWGRRHAAALQDVEGAFFSVNIVARKAAKGTAETNPYVRAFFERVEWRPRRVEVFAGKLDYPRYGMLDRAMIRVIMWMTNGPTDPSAVVEFTDWRRVEAFGEQLVACLAEKALVAG